MGGGIIIMWSVSMSITYSSGIFSRQCALLTIWTTPHGRFITMKPWSHLVRVVVRVGVRVRARVKVRAKVRVRVSGQGQG